MDNILEKYTQLLFDGFKDDPGLVFQMDNIPDSFRLFKLLLKGQIEVFNELGYLSAYNDGNGIIISYPSSQLQNQEVITALQKSSKYLLEEAEESTIIEMSQRALKVAEISKWDWFIPYVDNKDVLIIQVIVIKEEFRGCGLLKEMLEPLFKKCEEKDMRIALQTHNPANLPKYYHYGFKLIEEHSMEDGSLTCYNLLR